MTAAPAGKAKAAEPNAPVVDTAPEKDTETSKPQTEAPVEETTEEPIPEYIPNAPVPDKQAQTTRPAKKDEAADPAGNVTETHDIKAVDEFETDLSKLPVSTTVGETVAGIEVYSGRPIFSLSLVGWVGEAPFKLHAKDIPKLEAAIAELKKLAE